ncbi:klaroid protein [Spodoptera frugiperda]|uniref:Klaroid protein n=1 Tax=Spodoptera frugiperda TaxID=7108 RepID=A0A9R0EGD7_SPOFR|nr:klaroid protein [Spodoptera frugiperda]
MENPTVRELRSRSRSKTPFLRSSCDRENCLDSEEHTHHKGGRKTPVKRSTPIKQLNQPASTVTSETITEVEEEITQPVHQTRQATRNAAQLIRTSDYSSEESLDRLKGHSKEVVQNEINSQYERVSTSSQRYTSLSDVTLSPIYTSHGVTHDRSSRIGSPSSYSACSTDSSFAEQALADASLLLELNPNNDHLPSRLYKMAREYWNKYPKTDYTYSPMSKDRVELAPGQVAMPNMSRRSLSQFRVQGPNTSVDEVDRLSATTSWTTSTVRRRYTAIDSSDDESSYPHRNGGAYTAEQRWWITRLLISIVTTITSTTRNTYRKIVGPSHRYPYTDRRPAKASLVSRTAAVAAAPFVFIYSLIKTVVTTTVTTVTETLTPNHVEVNKKYIAQSYQEKAAAKKRWWPWLLLLLLPAFGYGYYNYGEQTPPAEQLVVDTYKPPQILQDPDLSKRVAALEDWAVNVDTRLKYFDQKLSRLDNLEAQIEQYSLKYLQQNLIQVFNENDNAGVLAAKLKEYFDKDYVSKEQMQAMSQEIHERLISTWKPDMDEDRIRQMVQEYLAVFERQQMEIIVERVKEYVKELEVQTVHTGIDVEAVKRIVAGMLNVYDADKTGLVDYALESAGGQVVSTKCTELYQIKTKQYSILGLPVWWVYTSPRYALTPGAMPAECWAFQGFPGYLVVRTYAIIEVTGFSLEHMSRLLAVEGKIESAPKNFSVYGLHGEMDPDPHLFGDYQYDANGTAIQYFPVQYPKTTNIGGVEYPVAYDIIELRVESNHGNPTYTCVYRFRVHGNPLSDIRRATEDSIKDSET